MAKRKTNLIQAKGNSRITIGSTKQSSNNYNKSRASSDEEDVNNINADEDSTVKIGKLHQAKNVGNKVRGCLFADFNNFPLLLPTEKQKNAPKYSFNAPVTNMSLGTKAGRDFNQGNSGPSSPWYMQIAYGIAIAAASVGIFYYLFVVGGKTTELQK